MDQRKIMSLGRSSLVISLPKRWTKLNELGRGGLVTLTIQKDNSLAVFPGIKKKREYREITLKVDPADEEDLLIRKIIACYLNGYFDINLIATDIFTADQQKAVRKIVGMLYMRILESDARRIFIRTLIDESKAPFKTAVRRMHVIAGSMFKDAMESIRNQDVELAKVVYELDNDVDQLGFFILRLLRESVLDPVLAQELNLEPIDCLDYQTLVHKIEFVADSAATIVDSVITFLGKGLWLSSSMLESLLSFGNKAFDLYNEAVRTFFSMDALASNDVIKRLDEMEQQNQRIIQNVWNNLEYDALTVYVMCTIRDSIKRIVEYSKDIAEITITHSYKPKAPISKQVTKR